MHRQRQKISRPQIEKNESTSLLPKYILSKLHILILIALITIICVMRLQTYDEPFERDIASHSVIGQELLHGRQLYSDLWDSKPPAIFITYAIFNFIFGMGPLAVYFLGITAAIITLTGVYRAGTKLSGKAGGLWAAVFWAFICSDLWLWANQPNIEVCINAALVWAFVLILEANTEKIQPLRWVAVGALFAVATIYKPVAITFAAILTFVYFLTNLGSKRQIKISFLQVCITAATGATIWGGVFAYFAATERLGVFYETVFAYGKYYTQSRGGSVWKNIAQGFGKEKLFYRAMKSVPVLAVLSIGGTLAGVFTRSRRDWLLLAGFLISAPLAIALPGRFYPHYYQLWLCPLVIGSGWAITAFGPKDKIGPVIIKNVVGVIAIIILLCAVLPQYNFTPDQWSANKYGPQFPITKKIAKKIDEILEPNENLYVWGINPEIYFWTKRRPPTGVMWSTDLVEGPLADEHTKRALEDLEKEKPKMVAFNLLHVKRPKNHPVILWILRNYQPMAGKSDWSIPYNRPPYNLPFFKILVRKDATPVK